MLKKILIGIAGVVVGIGLVYKALNSDFANAHESYVPEDTESKRRLHNAKSKNSNERFYTTKFKKDKINSNIISLGDFTINIANNKKLIMKISVQADEDLIDEISKYQAVIRNDVVKSVNSSSDFNQDYLTSKIIEDINRRFRKGKIEQLYFQKFVIQ